MSQKKNMEMKEVGGLIRRFEWIQVRSLGKNRTLDSDEHMFAFIV